MTRDSFLLGGPACLADLLRLEDLRTLSKHMKTLPRPAERELPSRDSRVAKMAADAGKRCVPHSSNPSLVTVFPLHMLGAIPNAGEYLEFSIERSKWTGGLFTPALEAVDGAVAIPDGPGWGVEINEQWLDAAERQVSEA